LFSAGLVLAALFPVWGRGSQSGEAQSQAVSLTVEVFERGNMPASYGTATDNRWTSYIKDNFAKPRNIDLSYVAVPRAQEVDKINVMMASKSAPDIIFVYNSSVFANYATQGGLTDLGPLIPSYAPELQKLWGEDVLQYGRVQGKQYAIYAKRTWLAHNVSYIRKDWLDKIGYQYKTYNGYPALNTDELFTVLSEFIARNVSGRGAANTFAWGVFGPGTTAIQSPWDGIKQAFYDKAALTDEIIATQPEFLWPGTKEAFRYINRMYNAGLMDPDFALQKDHQQFVARAANGQVGFFTATDGWGTSETDPSQNFMYLLYQKEPGAEWVGLNLMNARTGQPAYRYQYSPTGMIIMIPAFSKAAPQALEYLNWLAQPENEKELRFGVEGEHINWVNGIPVPIDLDYNNNTRISMGDLTIMYNGDPEPARDLAARLLPLSDRMKPLYQAYYDLGNQPPTWQNYAFAQPIESETKYSSNLQAKKNEIYTQSVMAKPQDFDAVYDRLVREYLAIGGQEIIDEKVKAWRNR
jgi:putative aldouronate transport system substrate-binding protein